MQIDIIANDGKVVTGNLQTGERDVRFVMNADDYRALISDGFFLRDGKTADSAGILNTTAVYTKQS